VALLESTMSDHEPPFSRRRPAVFLDRDGVINIDTDFLHRPEDCIFVEGVAPAIERLNRSGRLVIVVTNQSGVARGFYGESDVHQLHDFMRQSLLEQGARIDAFYHCPHHPEGSVAAFRRDCACRKPAPGMILTAMAEHQIDPGRSFLIGDRNSDIAAAQAAGLPGYLFRGGNLDAFVEAILMRENVSAGSTDDLERVVLPHGRGP
jgi:D-glycero-D-manno-heptose 1,7-bisphosphate phosphatase